MKEEIDSALVEYATSVIEKIYRLTNTPIFNKDGLPIGETFVGRHKTMPSLKVGLNKYYVRDKEYTSLSTAAKAVAGHSVNGWVFWETRSGATVDAQYRKHRK